MAIRCVIPAEIAQDFQRSAEGRLGVDHPVLTVHPAKKLAKLFWISQRGRRAGAAQLLASMETFQAAQKLARNTRLRTFTVERMDSVAVSSGCGLERVRPPEWRSEYADGEAGSVPRYAEY